MNEQEQKALYTKGFEDFLEANPEAFLRAVRTNEVKPDGTFPTLEFFIEMIELGKQES